MIDDASSRVIAAAPDAGAGDPDVLFVSLGSTAGLRRADDDLVASMRRAGAAVTIARAEDPGERRTLALTDLVWARAAQRTAQAALKSGSPRAVLYSTSTAALLWPRPGAIRYDALAAANRPGRHGVWQRPLERRRLRQATLLLPWLADPDHPDAIALAPPVDASGPPEAKDIAAITYGANASKKGSTASSRHGRQPVPATTSSSSPGSTHRPRVRPPESATQAGSYRPNTGRYCVAPAST